MMPENQMMGGGNLLNTLSPNTPPSPTNNMENPADTLINQVAPIVDQLTKLIESYPAAESEGRQAVQALYQFIDKAVGSLNEGVENSNPSLPQQGMGY